VRELAAGLAASFAAGDLDAARVALRAIEGLLAAPSAAASTSAPLAAVIDLTEQRQHRQGSRGR
jgi:hypothetical protein